jgi:hypothetical protein
MEEMKKLDQKTLTIRAYVQPHQELEIIEPVRVSIQHPWEGANLDRPLEVKNVGRIRLKSNAPWALYARVVTNTRFSVSIRLAGSRDWLPVSGGPVLHGKMGSYDLTFDVRVEPLGDCAPCQEVVEIGFTAAVAE